MCSGIGLLAGQRTSSENSRAGAAYLGLPTFPDDTRQPASGCSSRAARVCGGQACTIPARGSEG